MALGEDMKANLVKLRKKTGYTLGNCKKALEAAENDFDKAETWLEDKAKEQGWAKVGNLDRMATQGLIGIALGQQHAAMVEVNCETDFVAKNDKFQELVDTVAKTCVQVAKSDSPPPNEISKKTLTGIEMEGLRGGHESLGGMVAMTAGLMGERLVLRRAALVAAGPGLRVSALTHPTSGMKGGLGSILVYSSAKGDSEELAEQLCQQVIAMRPVSVDGPAAAGTDLEQPALLRQQFLRDPGRTVAEVADQAALQVRDFVRFECGESLPE